MTGDSQMTDNMAPQALALEDGSVIAYHKIEGNSPGVIFLGGFMSDMTGTKATALEAHCRAHGRAFIRFDYQGHGQSSGRFRDGTIGRWRDDAIAVLDRLAEGPQVLVGSSMGGWIALLAALARPERVVGVVGIAAAPDFTRDLMWERYSEEQRSILQSEGFIEEPSEYSDEPYVITYRLIEEARDHILLDRPVAIHVPVRLLHGMQDADVPWQTALRLADRLESEDVTVTLVKNGDHRLSEPADIDRICAAVDDLCAF
ncbi:MAG: alpha/beta hydrolase [Alphaproteobacteria bacterium]|nr:MAG: alpha/beta hydrolase [Alphaproteobacteria bacterium]